MAKDDDKTGKPEKAEAREGPISNDDIANAGWVASIFKPSVGIGAGAVLSGRGDERGGKIIALSIGVIAFTAVIGLVMIAIFMDKANDNMDRFGSPAFGKPSKSDCTFDSKPTAGQRRQCPGGFTVHGN